MAYRMTGEVNYLSRRRKQVIGDISMARDGTTYTVTDNDHLVTDLVWDNIAHTGMLQSDLSGPLLQYIPVGPTSAIYSKTRSRENKWGHPTDTGNYLANFTQNFVLQQVEVLWSWSTGDDDTITLEDMWLVEASEGLDAYQVSKVRFHSQDIPAYTVGDEVGPSAYMLMETEQEVFVNLKEQGKLYLALHFDVTQVGDVDDPPPTVDYFTLRVRGEELQ